jgi:hypothetical protein
MRKIMMAIAVAANVTIATAASPTRAEAGCRGCWAGVAAGVIGAAIIAGSARGYYGGYGYAPAYYGGYGYYGGYAPSYGYAHPAPAYYGYYPRAYYPYAPRYYAPRYIAPRRYLGYAPYYRGYRGYGVRRAYVRRHW